MYMPSISPHDGDASASREGRIQEAIHPQIRRILYGGVDAIVKRRTFTALSRCDYAQIMMLSHVGLLRKADAARLLRAVAKLEREEFSSLARDASPRGLYMQWEAAVARVTGPDLNGATHLARSRNDLNAALCRLEGREPCDRLILEAIRLLRAILRRAREWRSIVVVGFTNYQPALPITLGHQAVAWATAIERDIRHFLYSAADLDLCPLGAGALAGSGLPIDRVMTASLLGFNGITGNSIDAVASRDFVLHIQAAASVLAITLGRIATDLLMQLSGPTPSLRLPDSFVGQSSALPQKRNPFVLEHVQARGAAAIGDFVASAQAMQAKPYSNGIAVGNEATRNAYSGICSVAEATTLLRLVMEVIAADQEQARQCAAGSCLNASALAEILVTRGGMGLRAAHRLVGRAVSLAILKRGSGADIAATAPALIREAGIDFGTLGQD